jgi:hypothetical protein
MPSDIGPFNGGSVPPFDFFVLGLNGIHIIIFSVHLSVSSDLIV